MKPQHLAPVPKSTLPAAPLPSRSVRWPAEFGESLLLVLGLRLALGIFAALALTMYQSAMQPWGEWAQEFALKPGQPGYLLLGPWLRFDALWYLKIAQDGYATSNSVVFYPLFPLLTRLVGALLGGHLALGGLLVSTVSLAGALTVLRRMVTRDFGAPVADRTVLFLLAFPTAFFFLAPFTESLFLFLSLLAIDGARRSRWPLAAIAGLLAGCCRAQGAVLVLPLLFEYFRQNRRADARVLLRGLVALLPAVGWIAFALYAIWKTGDTSPMAAQKAWGYRILPPWEVLSASWRAVVGARDFAEGLNLLGFVTFSVLAVAGARRLPLAYSLFAIPQLLVMGTRQMNFSPLMSGSRYLIVLFPAFVVFARLVTHRAAVHSLATAFILLQALTFFFSLQWGFVA